ncbi:hypothetical protein JCM14635_33290 [Megalodesulfovibrio paquesii]
MGTAQASASVAALLLAHAPDGMAVVQDGRIVHGNPALRRLLHLADDPEAQPPLSECIHHEELPLVLEFCNTACTAESPRLLFREAATHEWLEATASGLDWQGRPAALLCLRSMPQLQPASQPIAQPTFEEPSLPAAEQFSTIRSNDAALMQLYQNLLRTQDALHLSESQYRELFEKAPVGIFLTDSAGHALHVNPEMARIVGAASPEEAVREFQTLSRKLYVSPERRQEFIDQLLCHGGVSNFEYEARRLDGKRIWIAMNARIRDRQPDGTFLIDGFSMDVTSRKLAELALAEREMHYRALFEDNAVVMALIDPESGAIIDVNKAACAFYGWSKAEMQRKRITEINTAPLETIQREMAAAQCRGKRHFQFRHCLASGEVRDVEVYSGPLMLQGESVLYSCIIDITERVQAEAALRKSQQQLRHIADTVPGMLYQLRLSPEGHLSFGYVSDRVREIQGLHPADVLRDASVLFNSVHPEDASRVMADTLASAAALTPYSNTHRFIRPDGQTRWLKTESIPIRQEDGSIQWNGFAFDITDLKRAEAALQQSQAQLLEAQRLAHLGHFAHDLSTGKTTWSAEALRILGLPSTMQEPPASESLSLDHLLNRLASDQERAELQQALAALQTAAPGTMVDRDLQLQPRADVDRPEEARQSLRLLARLEPDEDGTPTLLRGVLQDVTARTRILEELRRLTRAAEAANRVKSEFLANMSHEIRTPLNGVMGMLQLLLQGLQPPDQRELTQAALNSTIRLTSLLSDILDLSAVESGRLRISSAPFRLAEVVESVELLFGMAARERGIALRIRCAPDTPAMLVGDAQRLRQILLNLVGNALKFTSIGTVTLEIQPLSGPHLTRPALLFIVRDTGSGIASDILPRIFDPFFQGEAQQARRLRRTQGVGLGLPIVRQLTALMGGSLCLDSAPGQGTACYVSLPLPAAQDTARTGPREPLFPESTPLPPARVLIVEDEQVNRLALHHFLKQSGLEVVEAEHGQAALEALQREGFDLVLMDIQMPVMDGLEATLAIRDGQAGETVRHIPIVALTAYAMPEDRDRFLAAGMNSYLPKPVEFKALTRLLGRLLAQHPRGQ